MPFYHQQVVAALNGVYLLPGIRPGGTVTFSSVKGKFLRAKPEASGGAEECGSSYEPYMVGLANYIEAANPDRDIG